MVYVWKKRVKFILYYPTLATVECEGWNNLMVLAVLYPPPHVLISTN